MERETKSFKTPSGKEVVVYTYITAAEANKVKSFMLKSMQVNMTSGSPTVEKINGEFLVEQEKELLKTLVVSIDGTKNLGVEVFMSLRNTDYESIVSKLNEIYNGNLPTVN